MARWFLDRSPQRGIPSVSLRRLLPDATFPGLPDILASGCSADSRRLDPGQVFVALKGPRHDGHAFVAAALERGAAAVVVERPCPEAGRLQVVVPDARVAHARLCQALAGAPTEALRVVAVTGTHGATTAAVFLRSIFEAAGGRVGLIGPHGWSDGQRRRPPGPAPLEPSALAESLAELVERGCARAVVVLPTEALDRRAAEGLRLDAALVTGTRPADGIPDRETTANVRRAQARLVRRVMPGGVVAVQADDPDCDLLGAVRLDAHRLAFALNAPADLMGTIDGLDLRGVRWTLRDGAQTCAIPLRTLGRRNIVAALGAAAVARGCGVDLDAVAAGLAAVDRVPGCLEPLTDSDAPAIACFAEWARTEAELNSALAALRESGVGKIHCVLAASINAAAHAALAPAAETGADRVVVTLGGPGADDPDATLDDLLACFRRPGRVRVVPDRRVALESTLALARPGDALLLVVPDAPGVPTLSGRRPESDRDIISRWSRAHAATTRRLSA